MIFKYLDCSTAHLTENVLNDVDNGYYEEYGIYTYPYNFGTFISLGIEEIEDIDNLPKCLYDLIKYALDHECYFIRLDADAEIIDELSFYEWR